MTSSDQSDPTLDRPSAPPEAVTTFTATLREGPGMRIGVYKILQLIGEGGFGSVFMAEQTEPVRRKVALKIIKLGMDTRQVVARFEQERQALAMMDHPNIARVFDAGATETGRPFFVMELVKGDPIVEYCDKNTLPIGERLELFAQVCSAVQHAHTKGIIHRDIKPSNILVSVQDAQPSPKVIDFGIAKATLSRLTEKTLFTEHRQLIGTPEYMSPEQAEGSMDIDTRTDVYSLGVLLYELLTGSTPFDSQSLRSAAYAEVLRIIREVEPPIPSTRLSRSSDSLVAIATKRDIEPRKLGMLIRGELDWIVMKAIEKDRTRRYETANGLAMDIRRHLAGEAVLAAPPSAAYRMRKFIRRHRVWAAAGAAVAGALLIGAAAFAWQAKVAGEERDNAVKAQRSEAKAKHEAEENATTARIAADKAERTAYQAQMVSAARAVEDQRMDAARALLGATAPRLRGWEYEHLMSRIDRSLSTPFPADWKVSGLVKAADSGVFAVRRIKSGGATEWVVLGNDLRSERLVLPACEFWGLGISPDGTRAAWAPPESDNGRSIVLRNIETGKLLATIPTRPLIRKEFSRSVSWSRDGERFLVCGGEGGFEVFDGRTGEAVGRSDAAGWAHFAGDNRYIFMHGARLDTDFDSRAYRLLDARTLEPRTEVLHFETPITGGGVSFRGSRIACTLEDGTLRVLEIVDGAIRERSRISPGIAALSVPAWSRDGRLVAAGSFSGRVGAWEADSGKPRGEFSGPQFPTNNLMFTPDSDDVLACDVEGNVRLWPIDSGSRGVLAHKSFVYPIVLSRSGGMLLTGGWDGASGFSGGLKIWDPRTGALIGEHGRPGESFWSLALTPDERHVITGVYGASESSRRAEVIDLATWTVSTVFDPSAAKTSQPERMIAHPDGRRVITAYASGDVYIWDISTGQVRWQTSCTLPHVSSDNNALPAHAAAGLSPDGRLLALADGLAGIRLVSMDTYADVRRWRAHTEGIWSLSFSADGKRLLSASNDDTVGVWETATGALVARLVGHDTDVLCAVMSPDGTRIASGGRDGYVRLWDTRNFENVAQLGGHKDYIYSLVWSPDGRQLISSSGDSTVRIWDTRTLAEQVGAARARLEALPGIEAKVARARAGARDPGAAVDTVLASPDLSSHEKDLARQVATRFAMRGVPSYYRAPRATTPIVIDGKIDETAWNAAPWSEPFVDIEGDDKPRPRFETRMRMCWDDAYLYIAAKLEEPHVWGTLKNRDDIVFKDNDFEVFVDPKGDGRWYGEVEVNALGAIFDLRLERPYFEGGPAHHEWSPPGMRAAVSIDGTLNDPSDTDRGWTVEIAIPHSAFADHAAAPMPPRTGDVWRINFSRVEWQHDAVDGRYIKRPKTREDNWVWTPQHAVNMHVPREWGFVEFVARP